MTISRICYQATPARITVAPISPLLCDSRVFPFSEKLISFHFLEHFVPPFLRFGSSFSVQPSFSSPLLVTPFSGIKIRCTSNGRGGIRGTRIFLRSRFTGNEIFFRCSSCWCCRDPWLSSSLGNPVSIPLSSSG